jgi:hypothetical protein
MCTLTEPVPPADVAVAVTLGDGVRVALGVSVGVRVGVALGVLVAVAVGVGDSVDVAVGVTVGDGVGVGVALLGASNSTASRCTSDPDAVLLCIYCRPVVPLEAATLVRSAALLSMPIVASLTTSCMDRYW